MEPMVIGADSGGICTIPECDRPLYGRGWCSPHYQRWYRHGSPEAGAVYGRAFVTLRCDHCGTVFEVYRSERRGRRFCSMGCYHMNTAAKCTRCGGPADRGGRKRLCSGCLPKSKGAMAMERATVRLAECPEGKRWCSMCDEFLPPAQFGTKEHSCSACLAYRSTVKRLVKDYGITIEEYDLLLESQGGVCAICGGTPKKQKLHVDHDHKTGTIRGLLCLWCNHRLLGGARDRIDVLRNAVVYMEAPPALQVLGDRQVPPTNSKQRKKKGWVSP